MSVQALGARSLSGPWDKGIGRGSEPAWKPARGQAIQLSGPDETRLARVWSLSALSAVGLGCYHWRDSSHLEKESFVKDIQYKAVT